MNSTHTRRAAVERHLPRLTPQAFPHPLALEDVPDRLVRTAALLPYRADGTICLMRPRGKRPEKGPAQFEICKGTRMTRNKSGQWVDVKKHRPAGNQAELLAATALREAMEEIGLPLEGIQTWLAAGIVPFRSISSGREKRMALFLARLDDTPFTAPDGEAASTEEVRWFSFDEALAEGRMRPDHRPILAALSGRALP